MSKKKKLEDIKVSFLGSSSYTVTGSCVEVATPINGTKYLLECGMCQESNLKNNYDTNARIIYSVDLENTKAIFLSHQHSDHISNILGVIKRGWKGKIYCTYGAYKIMYHMLEDSAFIHVRDCELLTKRSKNLNTYVPLYNENDVKKTMDMIEVVDYNKVYSLEDGVIEFEFLKNNHIIGAASIKLRIKKPNGQKKTIWYTGDIGSNVCKNRFVPELDICYNNNLTILEGTYSSKEGYTKKDRKNEVQIIEEAIREYVLKRRGVIVMPVFSLSRLQSMLTLLYEILNSKDEFKEIPLVADTRLGMSVTKEYKNVLEGEELELFKQVTEWENLKQISDYKGTLACVNDITPKIILSSSGFIAEGTHITTYLKKYISNSNNCVMFCGYSGAEGSLGFRIRDNNTKSITIDGQTCVKNANIIGLSTFSSHIQKNELLSLVTQLNTERIVVHHSNKEGKKKFVDEMQEKIRECNKTTNVVASERNMVLTL